ncbi:MAG: tetratricopeptide repeat protein [Tepidisphaeraceae bacterium]|jgi:predicted O-linked N-acetylglucosamine transferase (SPINDLY family)
MGPVTIEEALQMGLRRHKAGQLEEAENIYRRILATEPTQSDALHLLGLLAYQVGNKGAGLELIEQAIRIEPGVSEYHSNRGMVLASMGRNAEAVEAYRRAIELQADYPEAHNNLGNVLRALGRNDEAIAALQKAIAVGPDFAEAHNNLGSVKQLMGRAAEAVESYRRAVELKPDFAEAWKNLGGALGMVGQWEEAVSVCQRATGLRLRDPWACVNLAYALSGAGRTEEAIAAYRQALTLDPNCIEALNGLGSALAKLQRLDDAIATFGQALARDAKHFQSHFNLGVALRDAKKTEEAIVEFRAALELQPDAYLAMNNLGLALQAKGEIEESIDWYRKAIELKPDYYNACNNLGNAMKDLGRLDEAISAYTHVGEAHPDVLADGNRLFTLHYHPGYSAGAILREARAWNQRHAHALAGAIGPHQNNRDPARKLRIGYVSPDFRNHCQSLFTLPLLGNHDHDQFEIYCYAHVAIEDANSQRIRKCADVWRKIVGMNDEQVAQMIREDGIDILVDLTMHMANGRPLLFARKPAPVQVAWLAYPGTTGLETMDYRLTDPYLDPPGMNDAFYSEQSIRLPETFWCYGPQGGDLEVTPLPALKNGYVTFGCLNNFCKTGDATLKLWARVMERVQHSRLILLCPRGGRRGEVLETMGIAADRVEFVEMQPRAKYLREYQRIDLALDTFPYNGHTTSLDSIWMGVPVVTLVGETVVGRAGWSQLCNLDLKELAARSQDQFVLTASALAGDLPRLAELRSTLRGRMEKSALMDGPRFARNVESAYRQMWRRWVIAATGTE